MCLCGTLTMMAASKCTSSGGGGGDTTSTTTIISSRLTAPPPIQYTTATTTTTTTTTTLNDTDVTMRGQCHRQQHSHHHHHQRRQQQSHHYPHRHHYCPHPDNHRDDDDQNLPPTSSARAVAAAPLRQCCRQQQQHPTPAPAPEMRSVRRRRPAIIFNPHHHRHGHSRRLPGPRPRPEPPLFRGWAALVIALLLAAGANISGVDAQPASSHHSGHNAAKAADADAAVAAAVAAADAAAHVATGSASRTNEPAFLSRSDAFKFKMGEDIKLPCNVINADKYMVAWKRGIAILTAGKVKVTPDPRVQLAHGYTLLIRNATHQDAGDYNCQIATMEPTEITHTVDILTPPTIYKPPMPSVTMKNGGIVRLECLASGNPAPNITWSRRNNVMPTEYRVKGGTLIVQQMDRHKAGMYVCNADNGVGEPAIAVASVLVQFSPEITVDQPIVFTGEAAEAQLSCTIEGIDVPDVYWFKETMQLQRTDRHSPQNHATRYTLIIHNVQPSDFGNYTCSAENSMGKARRTLELTGKPNVAFVRSANTSQFKDKYNISWVVYSHSPIEEYKLSYRKVPDNPGDQNHIDHHNGHHGHMSQKTYANRGYNNGHWPTRFDWRDLVLPALPPSHELEQSMSYLIKNLEPNQQYEVEIRSKNKYGWSEKTARATFLTALNEGVYEINSFMNNHPTDSEMRGLSVTHYGTSSGGTSNGATSRSHGATWSTNTWRTIVVAAAALQAVVAVRGACLS